MRLRVPHWAQYGGPWARFYRGPWFVYFRPPLADRGWEWGAGHRAGGFYLVELGRIRIGRRGR